MTEVFNSEQALGSLNEISKRIDRIIAIAVAGNAMCEDSSDPGCVLFELIENLAKGNKDRKILNEDREILDRGSEILLREFIEQLQDTWVPNRLIPITPDQALACLNEISKRIDRIIAIAVAGNAMCEDSTDTQSVLFGLIEYLGRLEIDNEILLKEFIPQVQKVW